MKLIIDRAKLRTGGEGPNATGRGSTQLLNYLGFSDCLGFLCLYLGIAEIELTDQISPFHLSSARTKYLSQEWVSGCMLLNDKNGITREAREIDLILHFSKIEINLFFINQYTERCT